jgi:hypothetical protein
LLETFFIQIHRRDLKDDHKFSIKIYRDLKFSIRSFIAQPKWVAEPPIWPKGWPGHPCFFLKITIIIIIIIIYYCK